ncbi:MAG TPA: flagellar biosynthesis anti-sigma factor FlgM [Rubrivivax sp.]|nr:flagellar biosynthesis anti-sigma factor FlgM [Rubrivivax sp.]
MKIGPVDNHSAIPATAVERKAAPEPVAAAEPSARVQLSSQVRAGGSDAGRADFDTDKVERIAQAIRDGKFQINAEAIADQLIANAQELLPKRH